MEDNPLYASLQVRPSGWEYFEIDDILVCQERVPCTFESQVKDLGFLDHGSDSEHIEQGTKMELPFWLAKEISMRQGRIVSVELPKVYREAYRQIFEADATVVDLNKLGPYFYQFGEKLLEFGNAENPRIAESLLMTYMNRMRRIMDLSINRLDGSTESKTLLPKLDHNERNIFSHSQESLRRFEQWKHGVISKLITSKTVINQKKRKRTEDD
ncbi:DNA replication complex GINS protein PSF3-like [Dendronephthya gigantea]|uniref:DNA replication complex GINS protein PSF3-like n=1 Tax=Dendronephthya gigantea TaxID=151771 RepID=UPI001069278E|nr:DNA replication complex GINS protein PSF3-like [Dendronephthya gigantea]